MQPADTFAVTRREVFGAMGKVRHLAIITPCRVKALGADGEWVRQAANIAGAVDLTVLG